MTQAQEEAYYVLLGWLTQEIKVKARPENPGSPTEDSCPVPRAAPAAPAPPAPPRPVFLQDGGTLCHLLPELISRSVSRPMMFRPAVWSLGSSEGAMAAATAPLQSSTASSRM